MSLDINYGFIRNGWKSNKQSKEVIHKPCGFAFLPPFGTLQYVDIAKSPFTFHAHIGLDRAENFPAWFGPKQA